MYLTARAALRRGRAGSAAQPLSAVAAAAAHGTLLGARGNSGVILSQMLRGFAHSVRHRDEIDTLPARARHARSGRRGARRADQAGRGDDHLGRGSGRRRGLPAGGARARLLPARPTPCVRAANDALDRTPEQLPALKEAGVVDSGGAGFCYFLEGVLRFLARARPRARRRFRAARCARASSPASRWSATTASAPSSCSRTRRVEAHPLRDVLEPHGDSLLVIGAAPTIKVHVHTGRAGAGARRSPPGTARVTRRKVEDMARQHTLLVVDAPARAFGDRRGRAGRGLRPHRARARRRRDDPRPGRRQPLRRATC